jgi:membrane protease YdiL (CAAX protease family)
MLTAERNRKRHAPDWLTHELDEHLTWLQQQLDELDQRIEALRMANPTWRERTALLETITLFLAMFLVLPNLVGLLGLDLGFFVLAPLALAPLWLLVRGYTPAEMCREMGWVRGKGVIREVVMGWIGYVALLPVLGLGFLITALLISLTNTTPAHPIVFEFDEAGTTGLLSIFFMACIAAPVVEETLFRGIFYKYLRGSVGMILSGLITGLVFAAIHPQGWVAIPALGAVGFNLAVIREWRGSLIGSMAAHFGNNFVVLLLASMMFA